MRIQDEMKYVVPQGKAVSSDRAGAPSVSRMAQDPPLRSRGVLGGAISGAATWVAERLVACGAVMFASPPPRRSRQVHPDNAAIPPGPTIAPAPASPWSRMRRERQVRRTAAMLRAMDDQTLRDIGIHRSQIESVAVHGRFDRA